MDNSQYFDGLGGYVVAVSKPVYSNQ